MGNRVVESYVPYFKQLLKSPNDITPKWKDIVGRREVQTNVLTKTFLNEDGLKKLLFLGAPGAGKSTLVAGLATLYNMNLLKVTYDDLKQNHPLSAMDRLFAVFKVAKEAGPCILHFDGVEIMLQDRHKFDNAVAYRLTCTFKSEIENIESWARFPEKGCKGLLVAISTSDPMRMDPSILSKFQDCIHVPVLSIDKREEVIKVIDELFPLTLEHKEALLNKTTGFTYGDIQDLAEQIRRAQQYRERRPSLDDIVYFAEVSVPMLEATNQTELVEICNNFCSKYVGCCKVNKEL